MVCVQRWFQQSHIVMKRHGFMLTVFALGLSACTNISKPSDESQNKTEYFAESKIGVKASPQVASNGFTSLLRGGGRDTVGAPYNIKGKWYYPREDKTYAKTGHASWYGSAFHGRLTANGEVYDMNHLTAAHPTMPLPSYARVTNLKNGSSIIVRVNDRGPFLRGRLVDLSMRASEMLDYKNEGTTKVKMEYVGRAPIKGNDEAFLLASYRQKRATRPTLLAKKSNPSKARKLPEIGPVAMRKPQLLLQASYTAKTSAKI